MVKAYSHKRQRQQAGGRPRVSKLFFTQQRSQSVRHLMWLISVGKMAAGHHEGVGFRHSLAEAGHSGLVTLAGPLGGRVQGQVTGGVLVEDYLGGAGGRVVTTPFTWQMKLQKAGNLSLYLEFQHKFH